MPFALDRSLDWPVTSYARLANSVTSELYIHIYIHIPIHSLSLSHVVSTRSSLDLFSPTVSSPSMPRRSAPSDARIVGKTLNGRGCWYEVQYSGREDTTRLTGTEARKQLPALVTAFEAALTAQKEDEEDEEDEEDQEEEEEEGVRTIARTNIRQEGKQAADGSQMIEQMEALQRLVREQSEQLALLRDASVNPLAAAAAAAAVSTAKVVESQSRFARREPRAVDLPEYDGSSGVKLEAWLQKLVQVTRLYELNARETVLFATSRLQGAALQWWLALSVAQQHELGAYDQLAAALRARFQPITTSELARTQLDALRQGTRHINDYVAEFQHIAAQIGGELGEAEAKHAFLRGLRTDIANQLRVTGVASLQEAVAAAARVGGVTATSHGTSFRGSAVSGVHHMQLDEDDTPLDTRIERAVINALQAQQGQHGANAGFIAGSQVHPQRNSLVGAGRSGSNRRGRGGRFGGATRPLPVIPGVSSDEVRRRWDARVCVRCGEAGHRGLECGNAISAQPKNW